MDKYIVPLTLTLILIAFFYFKSRVNHEEVAKNLAEGEQLLASNRSVEGIVETPSGLQYQVLTAGTGTVHPTATDRVKVHYHGTLVDGTVFDSSVERGSPISFGLNQVIPGWTEGLQLMVVGEKARLYIPANLAYGNRATGKISGGSLLIFEIELLGINQ